jgi:hypothetical protein
MAPAATRPAEQTGGPHDEHGSCANYELAGYGVGRFVLADGDRLEEQNLPRHALGEAFLGANKAEGMAAVLNAIPGIEAGAAATHLDETFSDLEIDQLFAPADLIVVATDDRAAQRRLTARALALDIPAVVPGLYEDGGGEVFVQLDPSRPCFQCWDAFRDPSSDLRGVSSVQADALAVVQQAVWLSEAMLDPASAHLRDLAPTPGEGELRQLFVLSPGAALRRATVTSRPACPGCAVGESALGPAAPESAGAAELVRRLVSGRERVEAAGWPFVLTGAGSPPTRIDAAVSESAVIEGDTVTLSWSAENATGVEIESLGRHAPMGSVELGITATRHITLTAINPFGQSEPRTLLVRAVSIPRLQEIPVHTPGGPVTSMATPDYLASLRRRGPVPRERPAPLFREAGICAALPAAPSIAGIAAPSAPSSGGVGNPLQAPVE